MARVVITGGAGFLGSHLTDRFLREGCEVVCLDNMVTADPDNIAGFLDHPHFRFVRKDVTEHLHVKGPVDSVLHLASPASPPDYLRHPIETLMVGSIGTHNALRLAEAKGALFLLASTSEIYGDPQAHPQTETYWGNVNPVGPRSVYDEAKRFAEAMTMAYHRARQVETRIARIFNTYGPRMRTDDGRVVSNFIVQALRGGPIMIHGDGSQTRSFCHVSDMVEGLLRLLDSEITEPVNLGNPHEVTIMELASLVKEMTGSGSPIEFLPLPEDDPKVRCPDITLAREKLGWEPTVDLETGLKETIEHFRKRIYGPR